MNAGALKLGGVYGWLIRKCYHFASALKDAGGHWQGQEKKQIPFGDDKSKGRGWQGKKAEAECGGSSAALLTV